MPQCQLLDARRGAHARTSVEQQLGIRLGETTPDGRFTLSTAECLGSCGTAPMMMVNDGYHENLTDAKLDAAAGGAEVIMPGRQLLMSFPVTATSHTLAEYRARGGYAALAKALRQMKPSDVTKEVHGLRPAGPRRCGVSGRAASGR